jgi:NADH:ubiquinone oxidoreductase subunit E
VSCNATQCHIMVCHVMSCHVMSGNAMQYYVMSCHVRSRNELQYYVMSCHAIPYCAMPRCATLSNARSKSVLLYIPHIDLLTRIKRQKSHISSEFISRWKLIIRMDKLSISSVATNFSWQDEISDGLSALQVAVCMLWT